ncbi:MAG: type II toxin-antitoxin system VapC family toxin [Akkermansiaceae bacterium]|nr:type II toxin-antitoxin system VapC family toxin [Verrucomicrobiales bacterium]
MDRGNSGRPETLAGFMICLDTNYLIRGMEPGSEEAARMTAWYQAGEPLITAMPAWFEFICGPLTEQQEATIRAFLTEIVPFDEKQARESARLFNKAGRKRNLRVDAMIAGTAMAANARLATNNRADFRPFVAHGLKLA